MDAKHQFKYTYNETDYEEFSPLEVNFEMPGEINLTQMLNNFEYYLKACGFVFSGKLDFVEETYPEYLDEIEQEPGYGCMADFDKDNVDKSKDCCIHGSYPQSMADTGTSTDISVAGCCGLNITSSPLESKNEKLLKEWNEGIAKLDKEVKKNKWVHGICNPPSPDSKKK